MYGITSKNIMAKQIKLNLVTVDDARFNDAVQMYFDWKDLNQRIKSCATRGLNFPDAISEAIACYVLGFKWNKGKSGDAYDEANDKIIEYKATSNFNRDTSSFSPKEEFDYLYFLRLDYKNDILYIYDTGINSESLGDIQVNKNQTVKMQQFIGRRPRFSILKLIIEPNDIKPIANVNLRNLKIEKM